MPKDNPQRPPTSTSWKPGRSGNPNGPPKGILNEVRARFGKDAVAVLEVFRQLALGQDPEGYKNEIKTADRIKAGTELLDRIGVTAQRQMLVSSEQVPTMVVDVTELTDVQLEALTAIKLVEVEQPPDGTTEH